MRRVVTAAVVLVVMLTGAALIWAMTRRPPTDRLGLFAWTQADAIDPDHPVDASLLDPPKDPPCPGVKPLATSASRAALLDYAGSEGVTDLYVSVYSYTERTLADGTSAHVVSDDQLGIAAEAAAWVQADAAKNGTDRVAPMRVWAAFGDEGSGWTSETAACDSEELDLLRDFDRANQLLPVRDRFHGIALDVEEGSTPAYLRAVLDLYRCVQIELPHVPLAVVVSPTRQDDSVAFDAVNGGGSGPTKHFAEHIVDLGIEEVLVMGYFFTLEETEIRIEVFAEPFRQAAAQGRTVPQLFPVFEAQPITGAEKNASIHSCGYDLARAFILETMTRQRDRGTLLGGPVLHTYDCPWGSPGWTPGPDPLPLPPATDCTKPQGVAHPLSTDPHFNADSSGTSNR